MRGMLMVVAMLAVVSGGCLQFTIGPGGDPGGDPNQAPVDTDNDGLNDDEEADLGTDPDNADSDGDTLADGLEIGAGTNPLNPDTDGDGLDDDVEDAAGTNPLQENFAGAVDEVLCDLVVAIDPPGSASVRVYLATGSADFADWETADASAFEDEELLNIERAESVPAELLGAFEGTAAFFDFAIGTTVAQLDDGSAWAILSDDQLEVQNWAASDPVVVIEPLDGDLFRLINTRLCEVIRVTPL